MTSPMIKSIGFLVIAVWAIFAVSPAYATETVTLQLKWLHQFQFAGYYAAKAKGYYREAGLEVNFIEAKPGKAVIDSVIGGEALYGVDVSRLLLARAEGKPVVALGVIFQHSPYILVTRQDSPTQNIHDSEHCENSADQVRFYRSGSGEWQRSPEYLQEKCPGHNPGAYGHRNAGHGWLHFVL